MKAVIGDTVVAQADKDQLISIEGNWYFPPSAVRQDLLQPSSTPYTCPWKGKAQYYSVRADRGVVDDVAWSYPQPKEGSVDRVGTDFAGYVAFWKAAKVVED